MTITALRQPSTCAWCGTEIEGVLPLLEHVESHLDDTSPALTAAA
jgi:hypothetical protein